MEMLCAVVLSVVLGRASASEDEGQKFLRVVKHSEGAYHEEHFPVLLPQEYPAYLARYGEDDKHHRAFHHQFLDHKVFPGVLGEYGKSEVVQSPVIFAYPASQPAIKYPHLSRVQSKHKSKKGEPCLDDHQPKYGQEFYYPGSLKEGLTEKPFWITDLTGEAPQFYQESSLQYPGLLVEKKVEHQQVVGAGQLPDGRRFKLLLVDHLDDKGKEKKEEKKKVSRKEQVEKINDKEENPEKRKSVEKDANEEQPPPNKVIDDDPTAVEDDKTTLSSSDHDIDPRSNNTDDDSNIEGKSAESGDNKRREPVEVEIFTLGQPVDDKIKQAND